MQDDQDKKPTDPPPASAAPSDEGIEPPAASAPTDEEIEAAAGRLNPNWLRRDPQHGAGAGQIVQSLARGRAHAVTVEIKRPPRRPRSPR